MNKPYAISQSADMTHGLRHPRTLREAFGPEAEIELHTRISDTGDALNGWVAGVLLALIVLALWMGWHF